MKSTGIIRRIDDLGRVVIPRELRRQLNIKDGDPLELFITEGGICFKPYEEDEKHFISLFAATELALYKMDIPVGLYADGVKVAGHPSLPQESKGLMRRTFGVWGRYEWALCHEDDVVTETAMEYMLTMAVAVLKEHARDIWGE